jgi:hypothetical protein
MGSLRFVNIPLMRSFYTLKEKLLTTFQKQSQLINKKLNRLKYVRIL